MTCGNNSSYGSIENHEVRTICENTEVEENKNEEQSNETIEHFPNPGIYRSQRSQILGKRGLESFSIFQIPISS